MQPHLGADVVVGDTLLLGAAAQDEVESKGLKPGYHLSGSRVETRRSQLKLKAGCFQAMVNWIKLVQTHLGGEVQTPLEVYVADRFGLRAANFGEDDVRGGVAQASEA